MSIEGQNFYPGAKASAKDLLKLAEEYRRAAEVLLTTGRRKGLSSCPGRLIAIHAVELYLNAFLMEKGLQPAAVRGMQHNLAARTESAVAAGLRLKKLTAKHLQSLTEAREYLVARYGAAQPCSMSQINRLEATLGEVAKKVGSELGEKQAS